MPSSFPPPYTVRISKRAHRPGLRIRSGVGLEVVLPQGQERTNISLLLTNHRDWILTHYDRLMCPYEPQTPLQKGFFIHGGSTFILLRDTPLTEEDLRAEATRLLPKTVTPLSIAQRSLAEEFPAITEREAFKKALQAWTRTEAATVFTPVLNAIIQQQGLEYNRVTFKLQKTRWGSCSAKKNININANILFLPQSVATYVLIHEVAHLYHLNHSPHFWQKVFAMDPQAMRHDKALRTARKYLPWDNLP